MSASPTSCAAKGNNKTQFRASLNKLNDDAAVVRANENEQERKLDRGETKMEGNLNGDICRKSDNLVGNSCYEHLPKVDRREDEVESNSRDSVEKVAGEINDVSKPHGILVEVQLDRTEKEDIYTESDL